MDRIVTSRGGGVDSVGLSWRTPGDHHQDWAGPDVADAGVVASVGQLHLSHVHHCSRHLGLHDSLQWDPEPGPWGYDWLVFGPVQWWSSSHLTLQHHLLSTLIIFDSSTLYHWICCNNNILVSPLLVSALLLGHDLRLGTDAAIVMKKHGETWIIVISEHVSRLSYHVSISKHRDSEERWSRVTSQWWTLTFFLNLTDVLLQHNIILVTSAVSVVLDHLIVGRIFLQSIWRICNSMNDKQRDSRNFTFSQLFTLNRQEDFVVYFRLGVDLALVHSLVQLARVHDWQVPVGGGETRPINLTMK